VHVLEVYSAISRILMFYYILLFMLVVMASVRPRAANKQTIYNAVRFI